MPRQMRLLDLFCCAGGASVGYSRAGFEVVGVDKAPQPNYPFEFIQRNALTMDPAWIGREFDAVHASPPCQFGSALSNAHNAKRGHRNLIPATRRLLKATGLPYIIENVEAVARAGHLIDPIMLCGTMFDLGTNGCELQRHRYFESNVSLSATRFCAHSGGPVVGVYGGHARVRSARHGGRGTRDAWPRGHRAAAAEAMGITWATLAELSEAIPPDYTEFLGRQLVQNISLRRARAQ